jgi:shikimate kinase
VTGAVVLVGLMGAGKTTVGRILSERLGIRHVDLDDAVEALDGRTVAQIFASDGEAAFRRVERAALVRVLSEGPCVLSTGGGVVEDEENRDDLRSAGLVVWLDAPVATLADRVGGGGDRPLLADGAAAALARLDARRRGWYAAVADASVDTAGLTPPEVAERVAALVVEAS